MITTRFCRNRSRSCCSSSGRERLPSRHCRLLRSPPSPSAGISTLDMCAGSRRSLQSCISITTSPPGTEFLLGTQGFPLFLGKDEKGYTVENILKSLPFLRRIKPKFGSLVLLLSFFLNFICLTYVFLLLIKKIQKLCSRFSQILFPVFLNLGEYVGRES